MITSHHALSDTHFLLPFAYSQKIHGVNAARILTILDSKTLGVLLNQDVFLLKLQRMLDTLDGSGLDGKDDPEEILALRIADLNSAGIKTVRELRQAIQENEPYLFDFIAISMDKVIDDHSGGIYYRSACLTFLCQFMLGKKGNFKQILKYIARRNTTKFEEFEVEWAKKIIRDVTRIIGVDNSTRST